MLLQYVKYECPLLRSKTFKTTQRLSRSSSLSAVLFFSVHSSYTLYNTTAIVGYTATVPKLSIILITSYASFCISLKASVTLQCLSSVRMHQIRVQGLFKTYLREKMFEACYRRARLLF